MLQCYGETYHNAANLGNYGPMGDAMARLSKTTLSLSCNLIFRVL